MKNKLKFLTRLLRKLKNIRLTTQPKTIIENSQVTGLIQFIPGKVIVHYKTAFDFQETLNAIADAETFTGLPYMKRFYKYTTIIKN